MRFAALLTVAALALPALAKPVVIPLPRGALAPTETDKRATPVERRGSSVGTPSATNQAGINEWLSLHNNFRAKYGQSSRSGSSTLIAGLSD